MSTEKMTPPEAAGGRSLPSELPKVINNGYTCVKCGKRTVFTPTLKERGMTPAEARSIFVGRTGGKCDDCFLADRSNRG